MVNTIILVYVPPYWIFADSVTTFLCILLKIMLLTNCRNSTQIALAKWNFILNTEYPHNYKIKERTQIQSVWGGCLHAHLSFSPSFCQEVLSLNDLKCSFATSAIRKNILSPSVYSSSGIFLFSATWSFVYPSWRLVWYIDRHTTCPLLCFL